MTGPSCFLFPEKRNAFFIKIFRLLKFFLFKSQKPRLCSDAAMPFLSPISLRDFKTFIKKCPSAFIFSEKILQLIRDCWEDLQCIFCHRHLWTLKDFFHNSLKVPCWDYLRIWYCSKVIKMNCNPEIVLVSVLIFRLSSKSFFVSLISPLQRATVPRSLIVFPIPYLLPVCLNFSRLLLNNSSARLYSPY